MRKKLIGKTAFFIKDFFTSTGPECGRVYVGGTSMFIIEATVSDNIPFIF